MSARILVVSGDDVGLSATVKVLSRAGYRALGASTFQEAGRLLAAESPDLMIADERLGAYNGLHLIVRGRAYRPEMGAIVTTVAKNPGLEVDAVRLNAQCLVKPTDPSDWLMTISQTLESRTVHHHLTAAG